MSSATKEFPKRYDKAQLVMPDRNSRDPFPQNTPVGIVVHHTADRDLGRVRTSLDQNGLGYHLIIARDGSVTQHGWLDRQMWHAGKALWNGHSPNHRFLGVSLLSWGEVKLDDVDGRWKSWSGATIPETEVVHRQANVGQGFFYWDAATPEQFKSLTDVCLWLCNQGIWPKLVCGHDECALPRGRKSDPGGVLPVSMMDFRDMLTVRTRPLRILS